MADFVGETDAPPEQVEAVNKAIEVAEAAIRATVAKAGETLDPESVLLSAVVGTMAQAMREAFRRSEEPEHACQRVVAGLIADLMAANWCCSGHAFELGVQIAQAATALAVSRNNAVDTIGECEGSA